MKVIFTIISDVADSDLEQYEPLVSYCRSRGDEVIYNKFRLSAAHFYSGTETTEFVYQQAKNFIQQNKLDQECDLHILCLVYTTLSYLIGSFENSLIENSKKIVLYIQSDSQIILPNIPFSIQSVKLLNDSHVLQAPYGTRPWFQQFLSSTLEDKVYDMTWIGSESYIMQGCVFNGNQNKTITRKDFLDQIQLIKEDINFKRLQKNYNVQDYITILKKSKIVISLLGLGEHCYRLFECLEVGVCVIQHKYHYEKMWADPTENNIVPTFSSPEELVSLVNDLLKEDKYKEVQQRQSEWYKENYSTDKIKEWAKNTIELL